MNTAADVAVRACMGDKSAQAMARAARACGMAYRYAGRAGVRLDGLDSLYCLAKQNPAAGTPEEWAARGEAWARMAAGDARRIRRRRRLGLDVASDEQMMLEALAGATRCD